MNLSSRITPLVVVVALSILLAGCGGSTSNEASDQTQTGAATTAESSATTAAATVAEGTTVTVELGKPDEFSLVPSTTTVPAGAITFDSINDGKMLHEMVVVKTDKTPAELTMENGEADEADAVGEAPDIEPGANKSFTVDLTPGHYILLCNLPGHYAGGMYAELTVT